MGLYADLQTDISDAFDNDLVDAVKTLTLIREDTGVYNPATGSPDITTSEYIMRCVVTSDKTGENLDNDSSLDAVEILILDSDKTVSEFKLGDTVTIDDLYDYVVSGLETDPVSATHTLICRKF